MPDLRVGIVGCGRMGRERARCVTVAGAQLAAVFDIDRERSAALASLYNARSLGRVEECFDLGLDGLFVCTAPGSRGGIESGCIEAGLPIFVEKPIGISVRQCERAASDLKERPVINAVGYMNRYRQSVELAREVLDPAGIIGFSAHWVGKRYKVPWWEDEQASGGPHNEQATHLFDLCRFLVGDVAKVTSIANGTSRVATSLECHGGVPGTVFYSCDGNEKAIGLQIFTSTGTVVLSGWDFQLTSNSVDGRISSGAGEDIFLVETRAFLSAVAGGPGRGIKSDFADAMKTQSVMDAVRKGGQDGRACEVARNDRELKNGD